MWRRLFATRFARGCSAARAMARSTCSPGTRRTAVWSPVVLRDNYNPWMDDRLKADAPRDGLDPDALRALVEQGLSIRQISAACGFSPTAVRYWLRKSGLTTRTARYERSDEPKPHEILRACSTHGHTAFRRTGRAGGYRCVRCASARVSERRRQAKAILVAELGGSCVLCGYDRYVGALHFHDLDRAEKLLQFGARGLTRSLAILRKEAEKCVLLCANCHAEVEAGVVPADILTADGPG